MKKIRRSGVAFMPTSGFELIRLQNIGMEMVGFHQHNDIELGLLDSQPIEFFVGSQKVTLPAFRLHVFWSLVPHRNINPPPDASWWGLNLPFSVFLSWRLPEEFVHMILQGRMIIDPLMGGERDADNFARWHEDFLSHNAERIHSATLEIEARLRRLAVAVHEESLRDVDSPPPSAPRSQADLGRIEKMACFIAEHYLEPIQIKEIAEAANVHPKYAMRLFRRACDITLLQYLTQHRVWHAQRLLATSALSLDQIARDSGFGSLSRFHEVFKRHCHVSPHDYRKASDH